MIIRFCSQLRLKLVNVMKLLWVAMLAVVTIGSPLFEPPRKPFDEDASNLTQIPESSTTSVSEVPTTFVQEASSNIEPEVPAALALVDETEYVADNPSTTELEVSTSPEPEDATKPMQQAWLRSGQRPKQPRRQKPEVPATLVRVNDTKVELEVSPSPEPVDATKPMQQARLRSSQRPQQPRRQKPQADLWAHHFRPFQTTYGFDRMISMDELMRHSIPLKVQVRNDANDQNETLSSY